MPIGSSNISQPNRVYECHYLENGGSSEMNIDGTTPKTFSWAPPSGETWRLEEISIFLLDPGPMDNNKFAGLNLALTTGLDLILTP